MYDAGTQSQRSETTWRGGVGKEVGGGCRGRGQVYAYGQFTPMNGKNHHNMVKLLAFN